MTTDETPKLYPTRYRRPAPGSWTPAAMEQLPPGWVNVRIWSFDEALGRNLYTVEACPGVLHEESEWTEAVLSWADENGEIIDENGELYDLHPVVIELERQNPPSRHRHFVDPQWNPAYRGGGYLGSCPADMVADLLAEHGQEDAIPRPESDQ